MTYVEPVEPEEWEDDEVPDDEEYERVFGTLAGYLGERAAAILERIRPPPFG
jgi:hypothetical protein